MFTSTRSIAELEHRLADLEAQVSDLRARQGVVISELARARAHHSDASRTLVEFVRARLDMDGNTARQLVYLGSRGAHHRGLWNDLLAARASVDRTVATMRLADAGASADELTRSRSRDLAGVRRMIAARHRMTSRDERAAHDERYLTVQPTLDESRYRITGLLPGADGRVVERAIHERSDELRRTAGSLTSTRGQRQADALVAMAHDSLDGSATEHSGATPTVTVFVDATSEGNADAEALADTGATIDFGPRVGPDTLERILCEGTVRVVGLDGDAAVVTSHATRRIPAAVRDAVARRDGGCTIDGCASRYRLQPHHIRHFAQGGRHDADNLTTLCWYHHHVAIHGAGYRIDPESPPLRRRLLPPIARSHDPPLAA